MTTSTIAENFRISSLLMRRAYEVGLTADVDIGGAQKRVRLFHAIKDNTRYPTVLCQYETVEECLAFLDGYNAIGIGARSNLPTEPPTVG